MKTGMPKMAFRDNMDRLILETTDRAESKASAEGLMVRTFRVAISNPRNA